VGNQIGGVLEGFQIREREKGKQRKKKGGKVHCQGGNKELLRGVTYKGVQGEKRGKWGKKKKTSGLGNRSSKTR